MSLPEISKSVHDLADKIAEDALESEDKVFRLDAFKALSQFFIGITRISGRKGEDDDDEPIGASLPQMRARIDAASGNGTEPAAGDSRLVAGAARRAAGEVRQRDRNGRFE